MKHQSVGQDIYQMLLTGAGVSQDGRLPSERTLAEQFGVSRTSVRRAIDELCLQGWLIRRHGRGTFIKNIRDMRLSQSIFSVTRCAQHYEELGMQPQVTVLRQEVVPANETIAS